MNPDAKIYKNTLKNLIKYTKKLKNFGAIGPVYENQKTNSREKLSKLTNLCQQQCL